MPFNPGMTQHDRFHAGLVAGLPEPVRRYFAHALAEGAPLSLDVRVRMTGRIKVGAWLDFRADQQFSGQEFVWRARAGKGRLRPLHVTDRYGGGRGSTQGRAFGRVRFLHADDENVARAAAARGAAESIWLPASLLPARGVTWRAEDDSRIVASLPVPPEHPDVHLTIDADGAVRSVHLQRWGDVGQSQFGYIPFGGDIGAERRFGAVTIPSRLTVGWWYGTPRYTPFFMCEITDLHILG
jgi:hypothetical protein